MSQHTLSSPNYQSAVSNPDIHMSGVISAKVCQAKNPGTYVSGKYVSGKYESGTYNISSAQPTSIIDAVPQDHLAAHAMMPTDLGSQYIADLIDKRKLTCKWTWRMLSLSAAQLFTRTDHKQGPYLLYYHGTAKSQSGKEPFAKTCVVITTDIHFLTKSPDTGGVKAFLL